MVIRYMMKYGEREKPQGIRSPSVLSTYLLLGRQPSFVSLSLEGIIEDMIGHQSTLFDSFGLIKAPVDTEIDAALAVLFLSL
jgi:hypothetical protein